MSIVSKVSTEFCCGELNVAELIPQLAATSMAGRSSHVEPGLLERGHNKHGMAWEEITV